MFYICRRLFPCQNFLQGFSAEKLIVDCRHCTVAIRTIDQNRNLDLTGGNHANVNVCLEESLKHFCCNAGMALHTGADNGYLCDILVMHNTGSANQFNVRGKSIKSILEIGFADRKADILRAVAADRLKNDVDIDVFCAQL